MKSKDDFDLCRKDQEKNTTRNCSWKGWEQRGERLKGEWLVGNNVKVEEI